MKNSEEPKPSKSDKSSPPPPVDQNNVHVYPDWAANAMQAYYGPRTPLPPYYNSAIAPGHAPPHPYMWPPPQAMMGPYGPPYAAVYSPGGVYAHPAVAPGPHQHGHVVSSSPIAATPLSVELPTKSTGNTDGGVIKKLKKVDGLAMSIGNGNTQGAEQQSSPSSEDEDTTDGSDGNTSGDQTKRKRSGKTETLSSPDMATPSGKRLATGNVIRPGFSASLDDKASPANIGVPPETWIQNERELKRERRKQSNRESARRSRLRKQAESEELAHTVEALTAENMTLKSEISHFTEKSEKLKLENAALMEKMKNAQGQKQITLKDDERAPADNTENLLSRVDNNSGSVKNTEEVGETYSANAKLHQLLDTSPRADAVAAG